MPIIFRKYQPEPLFGDDYHKLRSFLLHIGQVNYPFGRWDWMITHSSLDASGLPKIGLWEENNLLVAVATYDTTLGKAYLLMQPEYRYLFKEMLAYAKTALAKEGKFAVLILDGDQEIQNMAAEQGFTASQDKECDSVYPIHLEKITYTLPAGFRITSMQETFDLYQYGQVLWKGFNHEARGEGPFVFGKGIHQERELSFNRPNVNLNLKIAVVAPNGDFVSYCGMWQDDASGNALVEPVATDPAYRRMGLGRAAVLEGIRRCGELGAKQAFVGSSQQFYYSIGFRPLITSTWWEQMK